MPTGSVGAAGSPTASGDESPDIIDDDVGSAEGFNFEEDELEGLEEVGEFFSEARLQELAGSDDVESVTFLEVRINSEEIVMRDLGVRLPGLSELKLNNSNIPSFRDLGTSFKNVKVLWLARSNVQELDGMSGLDSIRELYLAFNEIKDLSAVMGCGTLEVLDLEGNCIEDLGEVQFLASCERLSVVTLEGNPIANADKYRADVLEALPQVDVLDDVERGDTVCLGGSDDESMGMPGGRSFALNVSAGLDQELDEQEQVEAEQEGLATRPRTASKLSPAKKDEKEMEELMMVHKGIKHARTGFDDLDFVSLQDCQEQIHNRPGSAVPSGRVRTSSRPTSASLRPGSTGTRGSGGGSRSNASPVESVASAESGDGRVVYRPGSTDSGGQRRPGTASSGGSLRRPSTASLAPGGGASSMRPRTAALGFWGGPRPWTAATRPGTAGGGRPVTAGGDRLDAWKMRRSARASKSGVEEQDAGDVVSDLTYGAEDVYCGNLARGLRKRNVTQAAERFSGKEQILTELSCDEILAELRRWKAETMNLALAPDADEDTSATFIEGQAMGVGGGDQLILGDGEDDDIIQFGEGRAEVGLVGGAGEEEDEEEEDEDAEALLERLREHSQRSCSRLFAAADAMHDSESLSDTESQAPTARGACALVSKDAFSSTREVSGKDPAAPIASSSHSASIARAQHPPWRLAAPGAVDDSTAQGFEAAPASPPTLPSQRYRRPTVAPPASCATATESGTSGAAVPRRPTPTVRAPTVRRRVPLTAATADSGGGTVDASIGGGAENAAPGTADGKLSRPIARVRTGSTTLGADFGTASSVAAAGHMAGGTQFGGANSLLGKARGPLAGRSSPLPNASVGSLRSGAADTDEGSAPTFAVPTPPPREDAGRGASARRVPIRPIAMQPL